MDFENIKDALEWLFAANDKCPYCDFKGEDQIGMEINSEKRLSEEQMMSVDWGRWLLV